MSEYFPEPKSSGGRETVELDLSNYATKADLKNAAGVDTLDFAKKTNFANLTFDIDKLDIGKLKNVPTGLTLFRIGGEEGRRGGKKGPLPVFPH